MALRRKDLASLLNYVLQRLPLLFITEFSFSKIAEMIIRTVNRNKMFILIRVGIILRFILLNASKYKCTCHMSMLRNFNLDDNGIFKLPLYTLHKLCRQSDLQCNMCIFCLKKRKYNC